MVLINIIQVFLLASWTLFTVYVIGGLTTKRFSFWFTIKVWAPVIRYILFSKLHITGKENVDRKKHYIFMSNHTSYFDIACLFEGTDERLHFIAKDELRTNPFTGFMLKKIEMIFVDRSSAQKSTESIRKAISFIKEGRNIGIFPEGTRSKTGQLGPFRKGGFKMALQSGVPIIPIKITNSNRAWPVSNFNFKPSTVKLEFKPAIDVNQYSDETIKELMERVKKELE